MKFLNKIAIISVVLFVIGLASSNSLQSKVPVYEVPAIKVHFQNFHVIYHWIDCRTDFNEYCKIKIKILPFIVSI